MPHIDYAINKSGVKTTVIMAFVRELGSPSYMSRLVPGLDDFDSIIPWVFVDFIWRWARA